MIRTMRLMCALALASLLLPFAQAADKKDKDLFNYAAQKSAAPTVKKVVFIADSAPHGPPGNHEFVAGALYLARTLHAHYPDLYCVVHIHDKMPKDLSHADAIVVLLNHGRLAATSPAVIEACNRGAGFMAVHYGVEVDKGAQGDNYLKWIGGYFETFWSVNPHWTAKIESIPVHETTRGVKPFNINDEWYYHMRFVDGMKGVTPVLSALPDVKTLSADPKKASARGTNPAVYDEVAAGKAQHLAWAFVRPDNARGFGFTGYHKYSNLKDDSFRTLLLNAVAWTAKLPVPEAGVPSPTPTDAELGELMKEALRHRK